MITLVVPTIPISSNKAYAKQRGGAGRVLTAAGRKYKNETKTYLARHYPQEMKFFEPDVPYLLVIEFTFKGRESLYSKEWPDGRAKSRYKTLDVTNRAKLFEDSLADASGLNDKQNFFVGLHKTWDRDKESTQVWAWHGEEEPNNPIYVLLRALRAAQPHGALPALPEGWPASPTRSQ